MTTAKPSERRGRSKQIQTSKPSVVLAFFSCLAWLYVAGRFVIRSPFSHFYSSVRFPRKCRKIILILEKKNHLRSILKL